MFLFPVAADLFSVDPSEVCVHHAIQAEDSVLAETLCRCVQMGPYQRKGQAPNAQPSHQQGQWTPDTDKDLTVKPLSWNVSLAHRSHITHFSAFF